MPITPHSDAGWRTDPPVSEPNATGTIPAATAAADPPDEPPGTRVVSHGFFTGPNAEFSFDDPIANSSQFVLPMMTAPESSSRSIAVALYGGLYGPRMRDPQEVCIPRTQILSLIAIGTPASDCDAPLVLMVASIAADRFSAPSRSISRKAFSSSFSFSAASMAACTWARAEVSPRTNASVISAIVFI